MGHFISFAVIFAIMIFIWTFVFLNRSYDKKNQSFLYVLSLIILWMVLSVGSDYNDMTISGLVVKTLYWYSMMTMAVFFLLFVYRIIDRKLDKVFIIIALINTLTIASRYLFPIDYTDPTFWRLSTPVVAPLMSAIFSFPAVFALFLVFKEYRTSKDRRLKQQLRSLFLGIGLACGISVISEYALPVLFHVNLGITLMYYAFLVFIVCIFVSIMKYKLLYMQSNYIYQKLFINSIDGIIIVRRNARIININNMARQILRDEKLDSGDYLEKLDSGDYLTDYIQGYAFEADYKQQEMAITAGSQEYYLAVTQYPIDAKDKDSAKLVIITDISAIKLNQQREKERLIEKSIIDPLTGVYNKQYFVDKYYDKSKLSGSRLSLLFIDVDNFKNINDQFGHLAGDKVLTELAACLKKTIRCNSEIVRFGGDEFIVLLENTTLEDAYSVAERILNDVNCVCFEVENQTLYITLSIGVIEGTPPVDDLVMKADMAMYQSKSKGKNTITVFSDNKNSKSYRMKV